MKQHQPQSTPPTWLKRLGVIRDFFDTIIIRTYTFSETNSEGEKVYLDRAYYERYAKCEAQLGAMPNIKPGGQLARIGRKT